MQQRRKSDPLAPGSQLRSRPLRNKLLTRILGLVRGLESQLMNVLENRNKRSVWLRLWDFDDGTNVSKSLDQRPDN